MSLHPVNLIVRFMLEILALVFSGMWAWKLSDHIIFKYILSIVVPIVMAVIWGVFNVPDDPSRSGSAPVITKGIIRLLLELSILGFGVWCAYMLSYKNVSLVFMITIFIHYAISYDRIIWLWNR